jgi:hypothetical protein
MLLHCCNIHRRESIHTDELTKTRLASDVAMTDELTFRSALEMSRKSFFTSDQVNERKCTQLPNN